MTPEQLHEEASELFSLCCELDSENRRLRGLITRLLFAAVERRELIAFAEQCIHERFATTEGLVTTAETVAIVRGEAVARVAA